jgi:hypothetical protein
MDELILIIIENLANNNIGNDIFRITFILIISISLGLKVYGFQKNHSLKLTAKKYDYIRKMFFDYKNDKRSFFFAVQEYLGVALERKEAEYLVNNNFYFFSKRIRRAYSRIIFKNDGYQLKHPVVGILWAVIFYILTFIPTMFYFIYILNIKENLPPDLFLSINIIVLPVFILISIISVYNLNVFGSAISICNYNKD